MQIVRRLLGGTGTRAGHNHVWTFMILLFMIASPCVGEVWTYDVPGGEVYRSPDYEVSVTSEEETKASFVHYSYSLETYNLYNEGGAVIQERSIHHRGPIRHSAAIF